MLRMTTTMINTNELSLSGAGAGNSLLGTVLVGTLSGCANGSECSRYPGKTTSKGFDVNSCTIKSNLENSSIPTKTVFRRL